MPGILIGFSNAQSGRSSASYTASTPSAARALALGIGLALFSLACAPAEVQAPAPPPPSPGIRAAAEQYRLGHDLVSPQSSIVFREGYALNSPPVRQRWVDHALTLLSKELRNYHRRQIADPFEHYRDGIDKLQSHYELSEEFAGTQGVDADDFRRGLSITTATAAVSLAGLHFLKPRWRTDYLLTTRIRIGYDVSQLDDPKLYLLYGLRGRIGANRNGLVASYVDASGRTYSGDLNIFKLRATMRVNF